MINFAEHSTLMVIPNGLFKAKRQFVNQNHLTTKFPIFAASKSLGFETTYSKFQDRRT
jgi:hypothetical protein